METTPNVFHWPTSGHYDIPNQRKTARKPCFNSRCWQERHLCIIYALFLSVFASICNNRKPERRNGHALHLPTLSCCRDVFITSTERCMCVVGCYSSIWGCVCERNAEQINPPCTYRLRVLCNFEMQELLTLTGCLLVVDILQMWCYCYPASRHHK